MKEVLPSLQVFLNLSHLPFILRLSNMAEQQVGSHYADVRNDPNEEPAMSMMEAIGMLMTMCQDPLVKKNGSGADYVETQHHDTYDFIKPGQFDLEGRSVFITGASKGIGRAYACAYAKAGASLIGIGARSALGEVEKGDTGGSEECRKAGAESVGSQA